MGRLRRERHGFRCGPEMTVGRTRQRARYDRRPRPARHAEPAGDGWEHAMGKAATAGITAGGARIDMIGVPFDGMGRARGQAGGAAGLRAAVGPDVIMEPDLVLPGPVAQRAAAGDCPGPLSSVSRPTRGGSSFSHHRTRPRTLSSSSRIRWLCSTPVLSDSSRPPGSSRRSSCRGCSRRTRCPGGRPRSGPTVSSGGLTALPRQHPPMAATWPLSRRGPCIRTDMLEATTSPRAPSH